MTVMIVDCVSVTCALKSMREDDPAMNDVNDRHTVTARADGLVDYLPPEVMAMYLQALLAQSETTVKDNGDGTYTHTWTTKRTEETTQP